MAKPSPVPLVRCHLDGSDDDAFRNLRYIPLIEFELWRYLMETRHGRVVRVEEVSVWVPEEAALWTSISDPEDLEPVLRIRFDRAGLHGWPVPVERFFPAETYPEAQEALLSHFQAEFGRVVATPGYFVPHAARRRVPAAS